MHCKCQEPTLYILLLGLFLSGRDEGLLLLNSVSSIAKVYVYKTSLPLQILYSILILVKKVSM